ncbi:MAG: hypothetical protein RJA58_31 [Pseudomonadota bacterium]|jgi:hypothetical protein
MQNIAGRQIVGSFVLAFATLFIGAPVMAVSEPAFSVVRSEGSIELRDYPGFIVAETEVSGDFDAAGRTGFRRVAGYIFGGNKKPDGSSEKIAMTAPVTLEPKGDQWRVHFVMPEGYQMDSLPRPVDPNVRLRQVPAHRVAAIRFSGFTTDASILENTEALRAWIAKEQLTEISPPQVARYNDPFTLPWNRRNEILIEIR